MRKVLHLRSSFDPGGTETLLVNLFNCKQNYFTIDLALLKKGTLIDQLTHNSNAVHHLYRKRFFDLSVFKNLKRLVGEHRITVVHTHQFIELFYAVALKIMNPRLKLIHHIHLMFSRRNTAFYLERFLSQRFATIVTVSRASKDELVRSFGFDNDKIHLLYNAVQFLESDALDHQKAKLLLKVPPAKGAFNVVMVANFIWGKDHETLFKAYHQFIREQLPQVNLYFVGRESEISERLRKTYLQSEDIDQGRVVFTGPIPNARVLLPLFDMVIMSCFSETFNLALVEAAAMGKVILASDIAVFRELSDEGKYFHLFKTGDARNLFESLDSLVKNFGEVSKIDHSQYFREKFGFNNFVRSLDKIYAS